MPNLPATTRAAIAVAIAGVTATLFTGCFANPVEQLVNRGVEEAIEGATGGDVSLSGELPADFEQTEEFTSRILATLEGCRSDRYVTIDPGCVLDSMAQQGPVATYKKAVNKLDSYTPLGYSLCGVVVEVGRGAEEFAVSSPPTSRRTSP